MNALTPKQLAFIDAFLETSNATKSAIAAGYSEATAHVQGSQLLKKPLVAAELARRRRPIEKRSALTAEKIMAALNELVDFDPGQCFDASGNLLPINQIPLEARKAMTAIDLSKSSIKYSSRLGSLELGAKLLGMVREQQTQQQAVQIIISQPAVAPESAPEVKQLLPEWE